MIRQAIAVCSKDMRSEIRTRYALNALVMFIIVVISVIKFSLGEGKLNNDILAGLLWIIIFFSNSSGLARVFVSEEERETSLFLKLVAKSSSVLLGKFIFNVSLSSIINTINVIDIAGTFFLRIRANIFSQCRSSAMSLSNSFSSTGIQQ